MTDTTNHPNDAERRGVAAVHEALQNDSRGHPEERVKRRPPAPKAPRDPQPETTISPKPKPASAADPLTIGQITIRAVDQIGAQAAAEIDQAAAEIRNGAEEVAAGLEKLAEAIRGHSRIASEHTANFVCKATQVLETVRALDAGLQEQPRVILEQGVAETRAAHT
jgi:hypothetical protein